MNEVRGDPNTVRPGPQLAAEAKRIDPTRPTIKSSMIRDDLESVDAQPAAERARLVPEIAEKLKDVLPRVSELHDYQYRLLKYYIEGFRSMHPTRATLSFYGIYDYWGVLKVEGLGGAACVRSRKAISPLACSWNTRMPRWHLHAVNGSLQDLGTS